MTTESRRSSWWPTYGATATELNQRVANQASTRGQPAIGGVTAGLIGGLAISVFMMLMTLTQGQDIWVGTKMAALPFLGSQRVMEPGFDAAPVLLGVLSHFAVSVVWGLLFAMFFYGFSKGATLLAGALWGIVVWLGMFYLVLPLAGAGQVARMAPVGMAIFEHLLFGVAVALAFLPFQRPRYSGTPPQPTTLMP